MLEYIHEQLQLDNEVENIWLWADLMNWYAGFDKLFPLFPKRWELADVNFLVEFKQKTDC